MKNFAILAILLALVLSPLASASIQVVESTLTQSSSDESKFMLYTTLKNTGAVKEEGVFELAFFPTTYSFFSSQKTCDPRFPYNVHRFYSLNPGESASFYLQSTVPPGTYRAVITHATSCCTNGVNQYDCQAKQPYGFESTIRVVTVGNPTANQDDQCNTDYEAGVYLKNNGVLNCAVPKCNDAPSASSKAVCASVGECNTGAFQTQVCGDGVTQANVRYCNNAQWQLTGDVCPDVAVVDEPSPEDDGGLGGLNLTMVAVIVLGGVGLLYVVGGKK